MARLLAVGPPGFLLCCAGQMIAHNWTSLSTSAERGAKLLVCHERLLWQTVTTGGDVPLPSAGVLSSEGAGCSPPSTSARSTAGAAASTAVGMEATVPALGLAAASTPPLGGGAGAPDAPIWLLDVPLDPSSSTSTRGGGEVDAGTGAWRGASGAAW